MKKIALVTGASRGIGKAAALALARDGWTVHVNYIQSRAAAEAVAAQTGGMAICADVSDGQAVEAMFEKIEPVDLLVNNAGVSEQSMFQDVSDEMWHRYFAVNVDGAFYTSQAVLPPMLHRHAGCIINISSIWGLRGASCEVTYAATKAALIGLTRSLAAELAPAGIRVNCVAPGVIHTDMLDALPPEIVPQLVEQTPLGRLGKPEDIAEAVAFLADERASFITGQVLTADGGFIL